MTQTLSAIIITKNEEANIAECLRSVSFCKDTIVVDSGSEDRTVEIAKAEGARVFVRDFDNYAAQKNFALSQVEEGWVFSLDADERASEELGKEILGAIEKAGEVSAYSVPRQNIIYGRHLKHGSSGKDHPVRLFQKDKAVFKGIVHEALEVSGETQKLGRPLWHYSTATIQQHLKKVNLYTEMEAERLHSEGRRFSMSQISAKPVLSFIYFFILKCGFLDGREGFLFAGISSYHEFLRWAKLWELERNE